MGAALVADLSPRVPAVGRPEGACGVERGDRAERELGQRRHGGDA